MKLQPQVYPNLQYFMIIYNAPTAFLLSHVCLGPPFCGTQIQGGELCNENMRNFVSIHWDVEPHILLMGKSTWASGQINPHIGWLLEKLGLDHARTTIPKYVQRGLMDPIDLAVATTLELILTLSQKKQ